jgi:hypothetical protein
MSLTTEKMKKMTTRENVKFARMEVILSCALAEIMVDVVTCITFIALVVAQSHQVSIFMYNDRIYLLSNVLPCKYMSSHISSLSLISTGDWICKACANDNDIKVGIEGHEYEADGDEEETEVAAINNNDPLVIDSEDDSEDNREVLHIPKKKKKQQKRKVIDLSDSDDSDEEYARWIGMKK